MPLVFRRARVVGLGVLFVSVAARAASTDAGDDSLRVKTPSGGVSISLQAEGFDSCVLLPEGRATTERCLEAVKAAKGKLQEGNGVFAVAQSESEDGRIIFTGVMVQDLRDVASKLDGFIDDFARGFGTSQGGEAHVRKSGGERYRKVQLGSYEAYRWEVQGTTAAGVDSFAVIYLVDLPGNDVLFSFYTVQSDVADRVGPYAEAVMSSLKSERGVQYDRAFSTGYTAGRTIGSLCCCFGSLALIVAAIVFALRRRRKPEVNASPPEGPPPA